MSRTKQLLSAAVLGATAFAGAAQAATVTITPVVTRYFPNETALGSATPSAIPANNGQAGIYEVAFAVSTSLAAADTSAGFTGFGNAFFDAIAQGQSALPAHLTPTSFGLTVNDLATKYNATGTRFVYTDPITGNNIGGGSGGATPGTPLVTVLDNGAAGDLKSFSMAFGTGVYGAADPRLNATQSSQNQALTDTGPTGAFTLGNPLKMFEILVNFDGTASTALTPSANPANEGFGLHNNTTGLTTFFAAGTPGQNYVLQPLNFTVGTIPEPTSLAFLAVGGLVAGRRRRA